VILCLRTITLSTEDWTAILYAIERMPIPQPDHLEGSDYQKVMVAGKNLRKELSINEESV